MSNSLPVTGVDTHAHIFRRDLPMASGRRYSPEYDATIEQYLQHLDHHGFSHGVLVQPSFLGTDNSYLLEALERYPRRLRGTAVVEPDITDTQLDEMAARGVVGIRLNLIGKSLDDFGCANWQRFFSRLAARGWTVEIQRGMDDLVTILPSILDAGIEVIVDHFGLPSRGPDAWEAKEEAFLSLLSGGRIWVKVSAAYRSDSDLAQAAVVLARMRAARGRLDRFLWGSDWPHTRYEEKTGYDDQVRFMEKLLPEPGDRAQILVNNAAQAFHIALGA
ncbi:amidohydrolase family protein [Pseudomonas sp. Marseille-QA0892]